MPQAPLVCIFITFQHFFAIQFNVSYAREAADDFGLAEGQLPASKVKSFLRHAKALPKLGEVTVAEAHKLVIEAHEQPTDLQQPYVISTAEDITDEDAAIVLSSGHMLNNLEQMLSVMGSIRLQADSNAGIIS